MTITAETPKIELILEIDNPTSLTELAVRKKTFLKKLTSVLSLTLLYTY